jgi:CheY-like chemotaxis protein
VSGMEPSALPGVVGQHRVEMTSEPIAAAPGPAPSAAGKRVLVVEDELMIRMLLEGMLTDLGHTVAAEAGGIDEALAIAQKAEFDVAVLDVNLNNHSIAPVVEVLVRRGVPFVFASGYGQRGVPEAYRQSPTLQKPFQIEALAQALDAALTRPPD